jgi:hypothetical protein
MMDKARGRLELRGPEGNLHYFLDGLPLNNGEELELLLADGTWLRGHYQWSGNPARWPGLRVPIGGPWIVERAEGQPAARSGIGDAA